MGATIWRHFTPYDPDANAAFQRLRQEVFDRGRYSVKYQEVNALGRRGARALLAGSETGLNRVERFMFRQLPQALARVPPSLRRLVEQSIRHEAEEFLARDNSTTTRSIDHLLELAGETGTHSILDVTHLAVRSEFAAAAPMLASDLRSIFGTDRPTREQAEDAAMSHHTTAAKLLLPFGVSADRLKAVRGLLRHLVADSELEEMVRQELKTRK